MAAVLTINGGTVDRVATRTTILGCRTFAKDGYPTLRIARAIGALTAGPDPWDAKPVALAQDGMLIFSGDIGGHLTHRDARLGWVREWACHGLARRAESIPVTDSNTLTDTARYNLAADDPDYIPSRAGRTIGQVVAEVLEMPQNAAALAAAGIGGYTSAGSGAQATCTIAGGSVAATTVVDGGAGYTNAPTVLFSGGGGSGATATATVAAGAVSALTITRAGSGYRSPPVVILSRLPTVTLLDLEGLFLIPPSEVVVSGERILQALEGVVQAVHPNHFLQVDVLGKIRFHDPRTWAADVTLRMGGGDPRVGTPRVSTEWAGCSTRCQVRGNDQVAAVTLGVRPWPGSSSADGGLAEAFAHDGLDNAQAKALYAVTDFTNPGQSAGTCLAHATVASGAVTAIVVDNSGYNYPSAPAVAIVGGGGTGASATATLAGGKVDGFTLVAPGSGYETPPTVTCTGPAVGQSDLGTCTCPDTTTVRVTSSNPRARWVANYWDQTDSGHHGTLVIRSETIAGYAQFQQVRVIANTPLTTGGQSDLTIDAPLPSTSYSSYQLFGLSGGASVVYRRYKVTNAAIASRMANSFPYPFAYRNSDGSSASLTSTPVATVFYSPSGVAPYRQSGIGIAIDPVAGTITTAKPTCLVFSANGTSTVPVDDLQVFLPVHTGGLTATWPPDIDGVPQYAGTAKAALAIERTKYLSCPDWRDYSNRENMTRLAREYVATVQDVIHEGSIPYFGLLAAALLPGHALNIAGNGFVTGWEAMACPIVAVDLEYRERGGATHHVTTLTFSNRRAPYSGAALARPSMTGQPIGVEGFPRLDVATDAVAAANRRERAEGRAHEPVIEPSPSRAAPKRRAPSRRARGRRGAIHDRDIDIDIDIDDETTESGV